MVQILMVKQLLEKCYEFNIDVHQIFADFLQGYDSIKNEKCYIVTCASSAYQKNRMTELKIQDSALESHVKVLDKLAQYFETHCGLKQGNGHACMVLT